MHELRRLQTYYRYNNSEFSPYLTIRRVRKIHFRNGLGFSEDGNPSWWYALVDLIRNEQDDLTKATLKYIEANCPKTSKILGTGCGIGWMLFWLAQRGFKNIAGFDYLGNVVQSAKEIAELGNITAKLWQADGFDPKLEESYDLILVLHWLYSAWAGNYGNQVRRADRETLLNDFLSQYAPHVKQNGFLMLELIDSISDYLEPPTEIYPVRHSSEEVAKCAANVGFTIERKMFNSKYGYLPRMVYVLKKS